VGMYETTKCPYCNHTVEPMRRTGINNYTDSFGPSEETCPNCNKVYKTERFNSWNETDSVDRAMIYIKLLVTIAVTSLYLMIPVLMFFSFNDKLTEDNLLVAFICCLALSATISLMNLYQCMNYNAENGNHSV
jgi:hypothetical protein